MEIGSRRQIRAGGMAIAAIIVAMFLVWRASAGSIAIYWGQNGNEASLANTCATANFGIVILSFLTTFGNGKTPQLNLAGHCEPSSGGCRFLGSEIISCQENNVKVFLSLGGASGNYCIVSADDAQNVANYLWNNYLGGISYSRPLGDAILDGIDFNIKSTTDHLDDLAIAISALNSRGGKQVYLSGAPQCPYPDKYLGTALQKGLFDYIWIQFYNNPKCQYTGSDANDFMQAWNQWTSFVPTTQDQSIFLGLPASIAAAASGFIPCDTLTSSILPQIKRTSKYGGVMLWSKYFDEQSGYSLSIKDSV